MAGLKPTTPSGLRRVTAASLLVTLGIVFGDIGTSPLYVMKAVAGASPDADAGYIVGAISCVIWTLTLQTTLKYVVIALRADNRGEGGILALLALLRKARPKWLYAIAITGAAALVADGVITPAITVTSAIEGMRLVVPDMPVLPVVVAIILLIFMLQRAGTSRIGKLFGPFMLLWFLMLGVLGAINIPACPAVLGAFNPLYAIRLLATSPQWFLIMGAVFLCTTGAEALYSDLGHCGRRNIALSWSFVKLMLILNYLGQGAWLISHPDATGANPFYSVMPPAMILPGVIIASCAAIIASQALLSGTFTIFSEAINLNLWPKLRIKYPSAQKGQLYIPSVNFALLAGCLLTVALFRNSEHMEAAYGLAITVTMLMTTVLLTAWLMHRGVNRVVCYLFLCLFALVEGTFLVANLSKFTHGGWFCTIIAGVLAAIMLIWRAATRTRASLIEYRELAHNIPLIEAIKQDCTIPKYASNLVYMSRSNSPERIESKLLYSIINKSPKRADHYWFIHIDHTSSPDTLEYEVEIPTPGTIYFIRMHIGFRVEPKISVYLRQIVEDLVQAGLLDLRSSYPSLRHRGIAGDFRFILLHRIFTPASECPGRVASLMRLHALISRMGLDERVALGLDTSIVSMETVPLIINYTHKRRITPMHGGHT